MTLGDIIREYREEHSMSMGAFSVKSGISKAYISLLEKNKHPKTGKAIAPSIDVIKQAAIGMGMDFNELFSMIDSDVRIVSDDPDDVQKNAPDSWYYDSDTRLIADRIKNDSRMRVLFDAARDARPEDLEKAASFIQFLKGQQNDGLEE